MSVLEKSKQIKQQNTEFYNKNKSNLEQEMEFANQEVGKLKSTFYKSLNLEERLQIRGYNIPLLKVQRKTHPQKWSSKSFDLPTHTHDIYDEISFKELKNLLSNFKQNKNHDPEFVSFKLDYQKIRRWIGKE